MENKEDVHAHLELVVKDSYLRAIDAALLQFSSSLPPELDQASANFHRIQGAMGFVGVLSKLAESPEPLPKPTVTKNLNWKA